MSLIMLNNPCAYLEHEMILILFNANLSYLERKGHLGVRLATGEVLFIVFIFGESEHVWKKMGKLNSFMAFYSVICLV